MEQNSIGTLQNVRIGIIARCDNSGLGVMTFDFFRNLVVSKVLLISASYENYHDRFDGYEGTQVIKCARGMPALEEIDLFLEDIDVVVAFETPYNWNIFSRAKEKGVKSVLIPMYEWEPPNDQFPAMPDLFLCPSKLDLDEMPKGEPKVFIPTPINREILPFKRRTEAKTFIFNNGHGGFGGRNSLAEFLQAIPLVKSDVQFLIRSQVPFEPINDARVIVQMEELNYEDLWNEGDVYLHLHKYDGLSLPLNEAMSSGIIPIAPDFYPHNEFLPKEVLFEPEAEARVTLMPNFRDITTHLISPVAIAKKIDEVASWSSEQIGALSDRMNELADEHSWKVLKPQIIHTLNALCQKE